LIVVATTPGREDWLKQCLESIEQPVFVLSDHTFELGKIHTIFHKTNIDRFMFLQDSVVVKDQNIFKLLDDEGSIAFTNDPVPFGMYMGVYERSVLEKIYIPLPRTKQDAIKYEIEWTKIYCSQAPKLKTAYPELCDQNATRKEFVFGRENLVLENDYLIKYKGNWGQIF
jgi:hypothetical protein